MPYTNESGPVSSLRARVLLLAGSAVVLLLITLGIFIAVLKNTQTTLVNTAARHLDQVASSAAAAYRSRTNDALSVTALARPAPPFLPEPRPMGSNEAPPPPPPPASPRPPAPPAYDPLSAFMSELLRDQPGIEGGFYRAATHQLGGYAFPTHEGPGPDKEMPIREQPTILALASKAAALHRSQRSQFVGAHDVVLFAAFPVCETRSCAGGVTGAIWLMQRLPGAEADRRRAVLWSAFAFGAMALLMVVLAFAVLSHVDSSMRAVLDRLTMMESTLDLPPPPSDALCMVEFRSVLEGLDRLALTLRSQMENERTLQGRLQQQERLAAIGQLAAGVAHELRNPLATIRLRGQLMQRSADVASAAHHSGIVIAEVDRLDRIIERLLTFARPVRLEVRTTDLALLCREAALRWNAQATRTHCQILYGGADTAFAEVDATRIRQVLDNLIENAVHASHEGRETPDKPVGEIRVECGKVGEVVTVHVRDDGRGFTEDTLSRAMEPFFTTRKTGTGLGLSIAYEIAHAHHGSLELSNHPDGGAVAALQLPVQPALERRS